MNKKLVALMLSVMIAACGCGAQTGASSSAPAQESEATQESEAAQEDTVAQNNEATQESTAAQVAEPEQAPEAAANSTTVAEQTSEDAATGRTAAEQSVPDVEAGIYEINKYGNIVLNVLPDSLTSIGYEPADIILVRIGDAEMEMPIGTNYTDVDSGEPVCAFRYIADGTSAVVLTYNAGSIADAMGIAEKQEINEEPGYKWVYADGLDESVPVQISMVLKQGYADEYEMHQISGVRSNDRADYPDLSDEEYANFRAVNTTGMGRDTLFRSSSPINPALNRNEEADDALLTAMVRTVMNMDDTEAEMKNFPEYGLTNYSECSIIALDMTMDFSSEEFRQKLADGFRFLASHKGPYLIHCKEGKDRTGFAAAILECLMGASADEVIEDYMLTFYNFYGITQDSEQYDKVVDSNIGATLAKAFDIPSIREEGVDLQACAEEYLMEIGMGDEEIAVLKDNLSKDYGGLN